MKSKPLQRVSRIKAWRVKAGAARKVHISALSRMFAWQKVRRPGIGGESSYAEMAARGGNFSVRNRLIGVMRAGPPPAKFIPDRMPCARQFRAKSLASINHVSKRISSMACVITPSIKIAMPYPPASEIEMRQRRARRLYFAFLAGSIIFSSPRGNRRSASNLYRALLLVLSSSCGMRRAEHVSNILPLGRCIAFRIKRKQQAMRRHRISARNKCAICLASNIKSF